MCSDRNDNYVLMLPLAHTRHDSIFGQCSSSSVHSSMLPAPAPSAAGDVVVTAIVVARVGLKQSESSTLGTLGHYITFFGSETKQKC